MVIEEHTKLEITLPDGRFFEITESDIIQNSLSVTSQCVNGNTFGFGCVSPAQLSVKIRIKSQEIGRYDVYGAEIILYSWFDENPPANNGKRGVFNVTSVTKNNDIFTISASDNICWLDASAFADNDNLSMGNAVYQRLNSDSGASFYAAADIFNIIVGEIAGLPVSEDLSGLEKQWYIPNATSVFKGFGYAEITGYDIRLPLLLDNEQSDNIRDYVAWIAEYMGGFVTADENGAVKFSLFENAWNNIPETLDFSEFEQNTLEISGFNLFIEYAKLITENRTYRHAYYFDTIQHPSFKVPENAIKIGAIIENNPFVEFIYNYHLPLGDCDLFPIVEALEAYMQWIRICPFSGTYHGKKYLHSGQYIKIRDRNGAEYETTITNITWKFRGGQQIKCVGEDTRTLSQARKRTQAVRMGERMKAQINRLESSLRSEISGSQEATDTKLGDQWNTIQEQIGELWAVLNGD